MKNCRICELYSGAVLYIPFQLIGLLMHRFMSPLIIFVKEKAVMKIVVAALDSAAKRWHG